MGTKAHMCRYGMTQTTNEGPMSVKNATGFLANSPLLANQSNKECNEDHSHVALLGGRTKQAHVHPDTLCKAACSGIKDQKQSDAAGLYHIGHVNVVNPEELESAMRTPSNLHVDNDWIEAWDDVSGEALDPRLAKQSRHEELEYFEKMKVYAKVSKQGDINPKYRLRFVAKEIHRSPKPELYTETPPLECLRMIISVFLRTSCETRIR